VTLANRTDAGEQLAAALAEHAYPDPVVLALPRGGVPVAVPIAAALGAPLDLVMARKIGVPGYEEVAAGAVVNGDDPHIVLNPAVLAATGLTQDQVQQLAERELLTIQRRREQYLAGRSAVSLHGRTAIVVDDGIATGATMRVALQAVRRRSPARTVLAVPVAPADTLVSMRAEVDDVVCLLAPRHFMAVGEFYRDFHQVSDPEVMAALDKVE
jgi:putative phosphoribosyl transferase